MNGKQWSDRVAVGLVVVAGCALMLATMGRAVGLLALALLVSYALWLSRGAWPASSRILPTFSVAVLVQCIHLIEEYRAGFYRAFPAIMGSTAWSARQFLLFNSVWLAVFILAGVGLTQGWRPAYLIALFLALGGGIRNGLGHILLSIRAGGYFPGIYTAPFVLLAGALLAFQLYRPSEISATPA
jgi:hypothetical protein